MELKRVLLMYISEVSGHHQATIAIERAIKTLSPDTEIRNINGFKYVYPFLEKVINTAYMGVIKKTPGVWDYLYDNPKVIQKTKKLKQIIHRSNHAKLARLFAEFQPQAVVCTQAFPCGLWADYKVSHNLSTKLVGVLTDYAPHRFWLHPGVDCYVVPSRETGRRFEEEGVSPERIQSLGIPIDVKFASTLDKAAIIERLGLSQEMPIILIMGGGQGLGPIKRVVQGLGTLTAPAQLVVVAGTNAALIRWLKKFRTKSRQKMVVYEYVNNVDEFMEIATLAITKPGGMTTAEALTKGLPLVIVNPLPGQEVYNTDFLLSQGAAVRVDSADDVGEAVQGLLMQPGRIAMMRQAAYRNAQPHAARNIAQLLLE